MCSKQVNYFEDRYNPYPQVDPQDNQHSHLDFLENTANTLGFLGGLIQINQTGTEYALCPLDYQLDVFYDCEVPESLLAVSNPFSLAETALKMAEIFRVSEEAFDEAHDREQEVEAGCIHRCSTFNALRSFAWTIAALCEKENVQPNAFCFDRIEDIAEYVFEERQSLNYEADSYCPALCSGDDIHKFYISDAVDEAAIEEMLRRINEEVEDGENITTKESIFSLEELQKEMEYLHPVMQVIYAELAANRDFSEPLTGHVADLLYAWCAVTYAARNSFYLEDGPMNNCWCHPGEEVTLLELERKSGNPQEVKLPYEASFAKGGTYGNDVYTFAIPDGFKVLKNQEDREFIAFLPNPDDEDDYNESPFLIMAGAQFDNGFNGQLLLPQGYCALHSKMLAQLPHYSTDMESWSYLRKTMPVHVSVNFARPYLHANAVLIAQDHWKMIRFQIRLQSKRQIPLCKELIFQILDQASVQVSAEMLAELDDDVYVTAAKTGGNIEEWDELLKNYTNQLIICRNVTQDGLVERYQKDNELGTASPKDFTKTLQDMLTTQVHYVDDVLIKADAIRQLFRLSKNQDLPAATQEAIDGLLEIAQQQIEITDGDMLSATAPYLELFKSHAAVPASQAAKELLNTEKERLSEVVVKALSDALESSPTPPPQPAPKKPTAKVVAKPATKPAIKPTKNVEEMRSILEKVRSKHREAESDFEDAQEEIERINSTSINIFTDDVVSIVAEAVGTAIAASETLHTMCQALVLLLDKKCEELLEPHTPSSLLREIADELESLNEDSEIDNNYTGSLDGVSFGDVANLSFEPTEEMLQIARTWRNRYYAQKESEEAEEYMAKHNVKKKDIEKHKTYLQAKEDATTATTAKAMKAVRDTLLSLNGYLDSANHAAECEQKIQALTEKETKEKEQAKRQAELEHQAKEKRKKKQDETQKECNQKAANFHAALKEAVDVRVGEYEQDLSRQIEAAKKEKAQHEQTLSQLGFFAFGEKKTKKKEILRLDEVIHTLGNPELIKAEKKRLADISSKAGKKYEKQVKEYLQKRFPSLIPQEPKYIFPGGNEGIALKVLCAMKDNKSYLVTDVMEMLESEIKEVSASYTTAILKKLKDRGEVVRSEMKGRAYFTRVRNVDDILAKLEKEKTEPTYIEAEEYANVPCPEPPSLEEVFGR